MNLAIRKGGAESFGDVGLTSYWDEGDLRARYNAVSDAVWIYRYRDLEDALLHLGWRKARRRVLSRGALSHEWVGRGRGDIRLGRRGLEMRFASGTRTIGWKKLREFVLARRS